MTDPGTPVDGKGIFRISSAWRQAYPGAHAGVLLMHDVRNPAVSPELDQLKAQLESELRDRFRGQDRAALLRNPVLQAYDAHYRRFSKTYHVQLQLESILYKGKAIPRSAALVEAMFMAELDNLLLTAGHDWDATRGPLTLDAARGTESYVLLRGTPQTAKAGDMLIADSEGVISNVIYGPDQRTKIGAATRNVIFTVYVPAGIGEDVIRHHLTALRKNVYLVAPQARVEVQEVFG